MASMEPTSWSWCGHCGERLTTRPRWPSSFATVPCTRYPGKTTLVVGPGVPMPTDYPAVSGNKRALLVGVSYKGDGGGGGGELKGTVNDIIHMSCLLEEFRFPRESILVLTDKKSTTSDDGEPFRAPTRQNMLLAMRWLVEGCKDGDSLVFYFSGHGEQGRDVTGDEVDWFDEALCPMDYKENGKIFDDEIKATIVRPLIHGVKLHAIVDTCHSGTILDLRYLCHLTRSGRPCSRSRSWKWDDQYRREKASAAETDTKGGIAISISGCSDHQISAEPNTTDASSGGGGGVMTTSFVRAVRSEPRKTYGELLTSMRATVRDEVKSSTGRCLLPGGRLCSLAASLLHCFFFSVQEPQLCSSSEFDVYNETFLL